MLFCITASCGASSAACRSDVNASSGRPCCCSRQPRSRYPRASGGLTRWRVAHQRCHMPRYAPSIRCAYERASPSVRIRSRSPAAKSRSPLGRFCPAVSECHEFLDRCGNQVRQAESRQDVGGQPTGGAGSPQRHDGDAHPQRLAGQRVATERPAVEHEIDVAVDGQIPLLCRRPAHSDA
jgi:hypothetical protein